MREFIRRSLYSSVGWDSNYEDRLITVQFYNSSLFKKENKSLPENVFNILRQSITHMFLSVCPNSRAAVHQQWSAFLDLVTYYYLSACLPFCRSFSVVCVCVCVHVQTASTCLSSIILSIFDSSPPVTYHEQCVCV